MSELGNMIAAKRKELNISGRELAKRIGVSRVTLSRFESGQNKTLSPRYWLALAEHLGMPIEKFVAAYSDDLYRRCNDELALVREELKNV